MNRRQLFLAIVGCLAVVRGSRPIVDDVFETEFLPEYSKVWRAACAYREGKILHWELLDDIGLPKRMAIQ